VTLGTDGNLDENLVGLGDMTFPICFSTYIWDSCKGGRLFHPSTYRVEALQSWTTSFARHLARSISLPARFSDEAVLESLTDIFSRIVVRDDLKELLDSVDVKDSNRLQKLVKESECKGKKSFESMVDFFRTEVDSAPLWLELVRAESTFSACMEYMADRVKAWSRVRPKQKSQRHERSAMAQAMMRPFIGLAQAFEESMLNLCRTFMTIVLWNSEESPFDAKELSLKKVDREVLEEACLNLHFSLDSLTRSFREWSRVDIELDFSRPTVWALKELLVAQVH